MLDCSFNSWTKSWTCCVSIPVSKAVGEMRLIEPYYCTHNGTGCPDSKAQKVNSLNAEHLPFTVAYNAHGKQLIAWFWIVFLCICRSCTSWWSSTIFHEPAQQDVSRLSDAKTWSSLTAAPIRLASLWVFVVLFSVNNTLLGKYTAKLGAVLLNTIQKWTTL